LDPYFALSLLGHREHRRQQYYDDYDRYNNGYNRPFNGFYGSGNPSVNIRPDMPGGGGGATVVPIFPGMGSGDGIVGLAPGASIVNVS